MIVLIGMIFCVSAALGGNLKLEVTLKSLDSKAQYIRYEDSRMKDGTAGFCVLPCPVQVTVELQHQQKVGDRTEYITAASTIFVDGKMGHKVSEVKFPTSASENSQAQNPLVSLIDGTWMGSKLIVKARALSSNTRSNVQSVLYVGDFVIPIEGAYPYSSGDQQAVVQLVGKEKEHSFKSSLIYSYTLSCDEGKAEEQACCPLSIEKVGHFSCNDQNERICSDGYDANTDTMTCKAAPPPFNPPIDPKSCKGRKDGNYQMGCSQHYLACSNGYGFSMPCQADWNGDMLYYNGALGKMGQCVPFMQVPACVQLQNGGN